MMLYQLTVPTIGGPGGSRVSFVSHSRESIRKIVDSTNNPLKFQSIDNKYFDILSWNPRGAGHTEPRVICYPDSGEQLYWNHLMKAERSVGVTLELISLKVARGIALSMGCSQRLLNVSAS